MSQFDKLTGIRLRHISATLCMLGAVGLMSISTAAYCAFSLSIGASFGNANAVFNWQQCPAYQEIPIERACFDRGGYQLYDAAGEAIIVPFADDNLYAMKFGVSTNGMTYLVQTDSAPILYLPPGGYLESAYDPSAQWCPFTPAWQPATPVFVGIAPSWNDYVSMGWYPNMVCDGGYWCSRPYASVGEVLPSEGLSFQIGGAQYNGWQPYSRYASSNPAPYQPTIINNNFYTRGGSNWHRYAGYNRPFVGSGRPYVYGHGYLAGASPAVMARAHIAALAVRRIGGNPASPLRQLATTARLSAAQREKFSPRMVAERAQATAHSTVADRTTLAQQQRRRLAADASQRTTLAQQQRRRLAADASQRNTLAQQQRRRLAASASQRNTLAQQQRRRLAADASQRNTLAQQQRRRLAASASQRNVMAQQQRRVNANSAARRNTMAQQQQRRVNTNSAARQHQFAASRVMSAPRNPRPANAFAHVNRSGAPTPSARRPAAAPQGQGARPARRPNQSN